MKSLKKAVVLGALIMGGQLYAQPADPPRTEDVPTKPVQQMSADEMRLEGTQLEAQVRGDSQHVLHLQAVARKDKDVIKLSCVNDKAIKQKAEANIFDSAHRDLQASLDKDDRFTLFPMVSKAAAAVHTLREEAERCIGEPELTGESGNSFVPPQIPDDPTIGLPFDDFGTVMEPPGYASPYS